MQKRKGRSKGRMLKGGRKNKGERAAASSMQELNVGPQAEGQAESLPIPILSDALSASTDWNNMKTRKELVKQIAKLVRMPFRVLWWYNVLPYVVLFLVCWLLYILIRGPGDGVLSGIGSGTSAAYNTTKGLFATMFGWIGVVFAKIRSLLTPSYKIQMFFRSISPFQGSIPTVPRQQMMSGRCDNLRWIQDSAEGAQGFCHSAIRPLDLIWTLDVSKMPEYFELPLERRMQLNPKMKVRIPYSEHPQDSFYVPECDKATFFDVIDPTTKKEVLAPLFEDTGMKCKLKEVPSTLYTAKTREAGEDLTVAFR